jgi:hypothetical protein
MGPLLFSLSLMLRNPNDMLAAPYLPLILFITGTAGGVIGAILWAYHLHTGKSLHVAARAVVGIAFVMVLWGLYEQSREHYGVRPSRRQLIQEATLFGVVVGALPGIIARAKRAECK